MVNHHLFEYEDMQDAIYKNVDRQLIGMMKLNQDFHKEY